MTPYFPFLGFPRYSRVSQSHYYGNQSMNFKNHPNIYTPKDFLNNNLSACPTNFQNKQTNNIYNNSVEEKKSIEYEQFINVFGFKLYFDDILIILILFFLYQEEIKDSYLYIILIMLLIS